MSVSRFARGRPQGARWAPCGSVPRRCCGYVPLGVEILSASLHLVPVRGLGERSGQHPAVDYEIRARAITTLAGDQEGNQTGDLFGFPNSPQRYRLEIGCRATDQALDASV